MADRYTRLYTLPQSDLYLQGSPVILSAGALLKDTQTGSVLAQLKFQNISSKVVRAMKISLRAFDSFETELEGIPEYQYIDLNAERDSFFGPKTAIRMPSRETRSFTCRCTGAVFVDGSFWTAPEEMWETLKAQKTLEEALGGLADQYRRDTGTKGAYLVQEDRDLWRCACGAINHASEGHCHTCNAERKQLLDAADPDTLQEHLAAYEQEQAEKAAAQAAREAEEKARQKAKQKKVARIAAPIAVLAAMAVLFFAYVLLQIIRPAIRYKEAVALSNAGKYEEAINAFTILDGYKDSVAQIEKCETAIKDKKYAAAVELYTAGKYEDAIAAFAALDGYKDSAAQIEKCRAGIKKPVKDEQYAVAVELFAAGKYEEAITAFTALDGYKDSTAKIKEIKPKYYEQLLSNASVGSTVFFGSYEQDNNTANGKEDIEWIVLAKEGNKVLVISKYALDCQKYNSTYTDVTWETCSLRKWLNGTFLNEAFNSAEQNSIVSSTVTADKNPTYSTSSGNNTTDKVFLLSIQEVDKYFGSAYSRQCDATKACRAQGAFLSCEWWLRSPGNSSYRVAYVLSSGEIDHMGLQVGLGYNDVTVRPAMWIIFR